jgi:hypothetical protein
MKLLFKRNRPLPLRERAGVRGNEKEAFHPYRRKGNQACQTARCPRGQTPGRFDPVFSDEGLERLLRLLESLMRKISNIDRTGFLDASVLGEIVHPQSFNTLRRIRDEDNSVIEEEEGFIELASNEFLLQHLRQLLEAGPAQKRAQALKKEDLHLICFDYLST